MFSATHSLKGLSCLNSPGTPQRHSADLRRQPNFAEKSVIAAISCVEQRSFKIPQLPALREVVSESAQQKRRFFLLLSFSSSKKARKAQETQSYQRIQCIGHMDFKGLSNAVTNTHPLLPSMGTTRQKSSCRNRLQNGPHSLLRMKVGTHSPLPTGSHTAAYTPKQGLFRMGALLLPSERFTRFGNPAWPGVRTAYFAAFGSWSEALLKDTESLRNSDALLCASLFRGVAAPLGCETPLTT